MILPPEAHPPLDELVSTYTNATYQRLSTLLVGALMTTGLRTVVNMVRTLRHLPPAHLTSYQRILSRTPGWHSAAPGGIPYNKYT